MASNFKIAIHQSDDNLHLKLTGDFDGSSAWELINSLKTHQGGVNKIFINTDSLKYIDPFGKGILQKNICGPAEKSLRIIFSGEKASELASEI